MVKEILQLESTNANDFKNEIVKDITLALKGYAGKNGQIDHLFPV